MNYNELWHQLAPLYGDGEAKAIAQMVYEVRFGLSLSDLYLGKDTQLSADCQAEMQEIAERLLQNEPVQYVLGEATFCSRTFHVEPGILIPRPETEHLCRLITKHTTDGSPIRTILDIGTGSGCIAITLALDIPGAQVTAWDISPTALRVAKDNAQRLGVDITFKEVDMLSVPYSPPYGGVGGGFDLIVSNPPYICDSEAEQMDANVLDYEPETALFVPDDNPLQFYVPIMNYAQSALHPGGQLWLETNPLYEEMIEERLLELGFNVIAHDDQFGKTRFIQAIQ
ncbi:MAG: peptide chain release factor N(5)-glutamine methyltransferase [Prevotella sp.]|nr:peptide chain release factor N(5)-glutamine methyltransferase [Prevotella sp.]